MHYEESKQKKNFPPRDGEYMEITWYFRIEKVFKWKCWRRVNILINITKIKWYWKFWKIVSLWKIKAY